MTRRILFLTALPLVVGALAGIGCLSEGGTAPAAAGPTDGGSNVPPLGDPDAGEVVLPPDAAVGDPTQNEAIADSTNLLTYQDNLATHPGCTTAGLAGRLSADGKPAGYVSATLPDFPCAVKEYAPLTEDPSKAIVVLFHGNSSTPRDFETNAEDVGTPVVTQLANQLLSDGWHVYSADMRFDKVYDLAGENSNNNPGRNMDHGWTVPIAEALIRSVHKQYPNQKINMAGFSLGTTIIRDALRRMHHRGEQPFSYVHALHLVSGANHGVNSYPRFCPDGVPSAQTMAAYVACQMGNRDAYSETDFSKRLNGPGGAWETPCADGINAFGQFNVCGANRVLYSTAVHSDKPDGTLEDEFVSETSAKLNGAANRAVPQDDVSKYFFNGLFPHHYGAIRSQPGVDLAKQALER